MIPFERLNLNQKEEYEGYLAHLGDHGCEYSFVNKFLWGRQKAAFLNGYLVVFAQFDRKSIYLFPIGTGDLKPVLDAIIHDARARGIPCYISGMNKADCELVETLYPDDTVVRDKSVLSFTPALCASMQAALCTKYLVGRPVESGKIYYFDLLNQEFEMIPLV